MDYLVKENVKGKSNFLLKWESFLMQRNTDAIVDLLIGFLRLKDAIEEIKKDENISEIGLHYAKIIVQNGDGIPMKIYFIVFLVLILQQREGFIKKQKRVKYWQTHLSLYYRSWH